MPGAIALTVPNADHAASQSSKSNWQNIHKARAKQHRRDPDSHGINGNSKLKLAKPISEKERGIISRKTEKLIHRRNALDREVLIAVEKANPGPDDWLPRDKLLRRRERLERRERHYLKKYTKQLVKLERLYRWDPSYDRAIDYDLVRKLLWRFKRNLGPLLDEYTKTRSMKDNDHDEMSSSASNSDSEWTDISDNGDNEEDLQQNPNTAVCIQEDAKQDFAYLQDMVGTKDPIVGILANSPDKRGKRKREDTKSTSSKKVRFAIDGEKPDSSASQESKERKKKHKKHKKHKKQGSDEVIQTNDNATALNENEAQWDRDILKNNSVQGVTRASAKEHRLLAPRRRLDRIVKEGFEAIDAHVYDTPNPPLGIVRKRHIHTGKPYNMSGGLSTDPTTVKYNWLSASTAENKKEDTTEILNAPFRIRGPQHPVYKPRIIEKVSLPTFPPSSFNDESSSTLSSYRFSSAKSSNGTDNENRVSVQNQVQTVQDQIQPNQSQRKTPVPAPQPWRKLGIQNPFDDEQPPASIKQSQSSPFQAQPASAPQISSTGTQGSKGKESNGTSGLDSSPIARSHRLVPKSENKKY
ncbi:hypothetical protein F5Y19DRAFT_492115 [Xylariaceae sp. FL1651]|nr:hypothetical protein F5Y19DRAFT_492115 [Xylariaceae sp. FL1651]